MSVIWIFTNHPKTFSTNPNHVGTFTRNEIFEEFEKFFGPQRGPDHPWPEAFEYLIVSKEPRTGENSPFREEHFFKFLFKVPQLS